MRDAIRRAFASPPPRGAVVVVVAGLLVTLAAVLLSRSPGSSGPAISYVSQTDLAPSPTVPFGAGGSTNIVGGKLSSTAPDDTSGDRLFTIETSLRARAGSGAMVTSVRCELKLPRGVHFGQSEGRRAVYPRILANSADDALKAGVPVDFLNAGTEPAGVTLRNFFFKYVRGGNPSVAWPDLAVGHQVWLWRYPTPVRSTRVNFAVILLAHGGEAVPIICTPQAGPVSATARTAVKLR